MYVCQSVKKTFRWQPLLQNQNPDPFFFFFLNPRPRNTVQKQIYTLIQPETHSTPRNSSHLCLCRRSWTGSDSTLLTSCRTNRMSANTETFQRNQTYVFPPKWHGNVFTFSHHAWVFFLQDQVRSRSRSQFSNHRGKKKNKKRTKQQPVCLKT